WTPHQTIFRSYANEAGYAAAGDYYWINSGNYFAGGGGTKNYSATWDKALAGNGFYVSSNGQVVRMSALDNLYSPSKNISDINVGAGGVDNNSNGESSFGVVSGTSNSDPYSYAGNLFHLDGTKLPANDGLHRQLFGLCAFYSSAAARSYLGGKKTDGFGFFLEFVRAHSLNTAQVEGIKKSGIMTQFLFEKLLTGNRTNDPIGALKNNNPVVGVYISRYEDRVPQYHQVLITGFSYYVDGARQGFVYNYWNSQSFKYESRYPSEFIQTFQITGYR
ncbi:hypothetical protein, partial [Mucilaginibacter sp.]|uniref:hypothetical protein n=1 Tax=Mucilaginibacter sp. TaxID=1882438 RepID=UPI0032647B94